jgi:hypothetical protein
VTMTAAAATAATTGESEDPSTSEIDISTVLRQLQVINSSAAKVLTARATRARCSSSTERP